MSKEKAHQTAGSRVTFINIADTSLKAQQARTLAALRKAPQSTFTLRSRFNILHPAARIQELREMGYRIDTVRQSHVDDQGRSHAGIAVYILLPLEAA